MILAYFFEFFWVIMFVVAFWHLSKSKSIADAAIFLIPGFLWGFFAELMGVHIWRIYEYPVSYPLTLFGVPLGIAFGWAVIMHFGYYLTTEVFHVRSFLNMDIESALISTTFDFIVLEPIAFVYKFWVWKQNDFWFGAPLVNFVGWFLVITLYLFTYHVISKRFKDKKQQAFYFVLALVPVFLILQIAIWAYLKLFGWF